MVDMAESVVEYEVLFGKLLRDEMSQVCIGDKIDVLLAESLLF